MKSIKKVLVFVSIATTLLFAAPKPLLNPFADTMNSSNETPSSNRGLPSHSQNSEPISAENSMQTTDMSQDLESMSTPLPTMAPVAHAEPTVMTKESTTRLVVRGQGVAPSFTQSPAQAFALAKRAAMVDAYRLLGEKIQGVKVEGQDLIKNMMVKRSQVRTEVTAMIREATVIETEFKDGLCEVEVELIVTGARWHKTLSHAFAE